MNANALEALDAWFMTPQGLAVAAGFRDEMTQSKSLLTQLHGKDLLQMGAGGQHSWLAPLAYQRQWIVAPHAHAKASEVHVQSLLKPLPFVEESMDCVVVPLALELLPWSAHPLDEWDRLLRPMGYLILLMVNAWSLWGLWLRLGRVACYGGQKGHPVSLYRLQQALTHRGYGVCHVAAFHYLPPVESSFLIQRLEIFNELGKMVSLCPAGFYCVVAQKYVPSHLKPQSAREQWRHGDMTPALQPVG